MKSPLQDILQALASQAVEGATGLQLDAVAERMIAEAGFEPAFKGYSPGGSTPVEGFPNVLCVSINGEVIHGIPDNRKFAYGDVIGLDCGLKDAEGNFDDGALTVIIGGDRAGSANARKLLKATREAIEAGIAKAVVGNTTHDISRAIQEVAQKYDVAVVEGYSGHGIGTALHMAPDVPNRVSGPAVPLTSGMRLAIEPMFSSVKGATKVAADKWTVKLAGGGVAAHFERTVTVA